jgi:hypothetical protein
VTNASRQINRVRISALLHCVLRESEKLIKTDD